MHHGVHGIKPLFLAAALALSGASGAHAQSTQGTECFSAEQAKSLAARSPATPAENALRFTWALGVQHTVNTGPNNIYASSTCFYTEGRTGGGYQEKGDIVSVINDQPDVPFFKGPSGNVNAYLVDVLIHERAHRDLRFNFKKQFGGNYGEYARSAQDKIATMMIDEAQAYTRGLLTMYAHAHFLEPRIPAEAVEKLYKFDSSQKEDVRNIRARMYGWAARVVKLYGEDAVKVHVKETGHFPKAINRLVFAGFLAGLDGFRDKAGDSLYSQNAKSFLTEAAALPDDKKLITLTDDVIGDILDRAPFGNLNGVEALLEQHPYLQELSGAGLTENLKVIRNYNAEHARNPELKKPAVLATDYLKPVGDALRAAVDYVEDSNNNVLGTPDAYFTGLLQKFGRDKPGGFFIAHAMGEVFAATLNRLGGASAVIATRPTGSSPAMAAIGVLHQ